MAISNVRVSGSGYTVITFNGKKVELLRTFQDSGQQPVATAEAIQGINDEYPTEIAFPKALGPGTLTFTTYELSGPTVMRPSPSTRAMEPPPAPISTMSITGIEIGMPEPFLKR